MDAGPDDAAATGDAGAGYTRDAGTQASLLSETGLYADITSEQLADGVRAYAPQGVLWSDSAAKQRWVYIPDGTQIDSRKMDAWIFPIGTKFWKEFDLDGQRIETRLLEKTSTDRWTMVAYQWADDQSDARAVPNGANNANGTSHDIPSSKYCARCHDGVADEVIGFSAVQLAYANAPLSLDMLTQASILTVAPSSEPLIPGTQLERDALLYLHANCANCHNDRTFISSVTSVDYALKVGELQSVLGTRSARTIMRDLEFGHGDVEATKVVLRMAFRGKQGQMPPIASEEVDQDGLQLVRNWVGELAKLPREDGSDAGL